MWQHFIQLPLSMLSVSLILNLKTLKANNNLLFSFHVANDIHVSCLDHTVVKKNSICDFKLPFFC